MGLSEIITGTICANKSAFTVSTDFCDYITCGYEICFGKFGCPIWKRIRTTGSAGGSDYSLETI